MGESNEDDYKEGVDNKGSETIPLITIDGMQQSMTFDHRSLIDRCDHLLKTLPCKTCSQDVTISFSKK